MHRVFSYVLLFSLLLGCHKGYVALWEKAGQEPVAVFPYPVSSLPPADQKALQKGIGIGSSQELARLLEDYLS